MEITGDARIEIFLSGNVTKDNKTVYFKYWLRPDIDAPSYCSASPTYVFNSKREIIGTEEEFFGDEDYPIIYTLLAEDLKKLNLTEEELKDIKNFLYQEYINEYENNIVDHYKDK